MNKRQNAVSADFRRQTAAAAQDVLVDLWDIDFRPFGGEVYHFCNQTNELGQPVQWQGRVYYPLPIDIDGVELTSQGAGNRPTLRVGNTSGFVTAAAERFNQLVGVPVLRRQTFARFLDAANFAAGNPTADPLQEVTSKYVIERLVSLTTESAALELAAPSESDGALIPSRMMMAGVCCWQYRGEGCGYTGRPVADRFDMPTADPQKDMCSGSLTGCRARFGATAVLPFGGFPSSDKVS